MRANTRSFTHGLEEIFFYRLLFRTKKTSKNHIKAEKRTFLFPPRFRGLTSLTSFTKTLFLQELLSLSLSLTLLLLLLLLLNVRIWWRPLGLP